MENESILLEENSDQTPDPGSSILTLEEEEIVRGFSLSPPGSPTGMETSEAEDKSVSDDGATCDLQT
ncbi:unnamed protein product, partial [Allacma fusca]